MKTAEMIEVMQAYVEGKTIEMVSKKVPIKVWTLAGSPLWNWEHCLYRIKPDEPKKKRMTDRQLSEWCARGNGVYSYEGSDFAYINYAYHKSRPDDPVPDGIFIRPWDSEEWVLPTVDIYERDCRSGS